MSILTNRITSVARPLASFSARISRSAPRVDRETDLRVLRHFDNLPLLPDHSPKKDIYPTPLTKSVKETCNLENKQITVTKPLKHVQDKLEKQSKISNEDMLTRTYKKVCKYGPVGLFIANAISTALTCYYAPLIGIWGITVMTVNHLHDKKALPAPISKVMDSFVIRKALQMNSFIFGDLFKRASIALDLFFQWANSSATAND